MVLDSNLPEWEWVKATTLEVVKTNSCTLWGEFKREVAKKLDVPVEVLKCYKSEMQLVIAHADDAENDEAYSDGGSEDQHAGEDSWLEEESADGRDGQEEEDDDDDKEGEGSDGGDLAESNEDGDADNKKRKRSTNKTTNRQIRRKRAGTEQQQQLRRHAESHQVESKAMGAFKHMVKAMSLGTILLKGLKQMGNKEAEDTLRDRLVAAGAVFKKAYPSRQEIAKARQQANEAKELEGIDMSNVIQGSRRRSRTEDVIPETETAKRRRVENSAKSGLEDGESDGGSFSSERSDADDDIEGDSESEFEYDSSRS